MSTRLMIVLALGLLGILGDVSPAPARTEMNRQEIRTLPIDARPSRVGHFYGNTVRRRHRTAN